MDERSALQTWPGEEVLRGHYHLHLDRNGTELFRHQPDESTRDRWYRAGFLHPTADDAHHDHDQQSLHHWRARQWAGDKHPWLDHNSSHLLRFCGSGREVVPTLGEPTIQTGAGGWGWHLCYPHRFSYNGRTTSVLGPLRVKGDPATGVMEVGVMV